LDFTWGTGFRETPTRFYKNNPEMMHVLVSKYSRRLSVLILSLGLANHSARAIDTDDMIAGWSFDDGTAVDATGNENDGEMEGVTAVDGKVGGALEFDGSDDSYVAVPELGEFEEFTISAWVKMTGRLGSWRVIYNVDGWSPGYVHHQIYTNGRLGFSVHSNPGGNDTFGNELYDDLVLDEWVHTAVVYSATEGTIKFYRNGELDQETDWGGDPVVLDPARIGSWDGGGRGFEGVIDEVVLLKIAATEDDVAELASGSSIFGGPIPPEAYIVRYPFDDGKAIDASENEIDGEVVGATAGEGKIGGALEFDGGDESYVAVPELGEHEDITIAAWVKMTGRIGSWRAIYTADGWSPGYVNHQIYPNSRLGFSIHSNPGGNDTFGAALFDDETLDTWHHSAAVYSSTEGTIKFYRDGVLDEEADWGGNSALLDPARIGSWSDGGRGFEGLIDEFTILNIAASEEQIGFLAGINQSLPREAAIYSFDDGTGKDGAPGQNDATIVGAKAVTGELFDGMALDFDGSDDQYVEVPDLGTSQSVTIAAWFKMTGKVGGWRALYTVNGWSEGWVHHQITPGNKIGFSINGNPGGNDRLGSATFDDAQLNVWHHSTVVYDGEAGKIRFYLDGALDSEAEWGGNAAVLSAGRIGGWSDGGRGFQGLIDNVVIWRTAATAKQVTELMGESRLPRPDVGGAMIAAYSFDDGTAADDSGNGNDGDVVDAVSVEGRFGNGLEFDGSDDVFVAVPDLGEHEDLTIAAWFKMVGKVGGWRVIYNVNGWSQGFVHHQIAPSNRMEFSIHSNTGGNDQFGDTILDDEVIDEWHHSAVVYSGMERTIKFYLDGVLDGESDWGGNSAVLMEGLIGAWDGGGRGFDGTLDEVIFLSIAADENEVKAIMEGGLGSSVPFQITDISYDPTVTSITWNSTEGATYIVETATDFATYVELTDGFESGGESTTFVDENPEGSERYYRVKKE
jgi:hypothetical protein